MEASANRLEYSTFLNQLDTIDREDKNWVYEFEKRAFKNK